MSMPRATLLLLAVVAVATAGRFRRVSFSADGYSKYEGQAVLRLETCAGATVESMSASAVAEGCRVFAEERLIPAPGACEEVFAICKAAATAKLVLSYGQRVHILHDNAGEHLRETSGVPGQHKPLDAFSLAEGAQDSDFYADWQGLEAKEARVEAAVNASGGLAKIEIAGDSVEGRPIKFVRFTGKGYKPGMAKVVMSYQVHAREWIAGMSGVYAVEKLAARVKEDPEWLTGMELVLVPLVNPDGYMHTIKHDRFHRKNMRPKSSSASSLASGFLSETENSCEEGVDLNRNARGWGGSDGGVCNTLYHGPSAMSEPETQAMAKLFNEAPMSVYLDFHSFAQFILSAWMDKVDAHPRQSEFDELGEKMKAAIQASHNETYRYGQGAKILYTAAGTLADHATTLGALGLVIELRPHQGGDTSRFAPKKEVILPTAEESFEAVLAAIDYAREMPPPTGEEAAEK